MRLEFYNRENDGYRNQNHHSHERSPGRPFEGPGHFKLGYHKTEHDSPAQVIGAGFVQMKEARQYPKESQWRRNAGNCAQPAEQALAFSEMCVLDDLRFWDHERHITTIVRIAPRPRTR